MKSCARPRLISRWRSSTADPEMMLGFVEAHRREYGIEPICRVLPIAPSTVRRHTARASDPAKLPARAQRDIGLKADIRRVFDENFQVYGVRKVWRQLQREGIQVARCTVARLMREMGLRGAIRGRPVKTTIADKALPCPLDRVNRQFRADRPDQLWLSDFTYVSTWSGFVYVAFIIDAFARRIVGWRVSRMADAGFVLDALEQALHQRRPAGKSGLVHHSDRGSQYISIRYTWRLGLAGIEPSVGSVGDSYDNALAETVNGLYKAEVIHAMPSRPGYLRTLNYSARWAIEPMFSDFKSRGFGVEDTQIQYPDRLARLLLVMALALHVAVSTGRHDAETNPTPAEKNT